MVAHRVLKPSGWWFDQSYHTPKPSISDKSSLKFSQSTLLLLKGRVQYCDAYVGAAVNLDADKVQALTLLFQQRSTLGI